MSKAVAVSLILASYAVAGLADDALESAPVSAAEAELIALDDAWIDAEVRGDRAALERILHEQFLATYPSGRTVDRATFIDDVLKNDIAPFVVIHESIRVHGDTALIIDVSESGNMKYTWVAVRASGQWRVISETFTKVTPP
jgi:hypothetical protein